MTTFFIKYERCNLLRRYNNSALSDKDLKSLNDKSQFFLKIKLIKLGNVCLVLHLPTAMQTSPEVSLKLVRFGLSCLSVCQRFISNFSHCHLFLLTENIHTWVTRWWRTYPAILQTLDEKKHKFYFRFSTSRTNYASPVRAASFPPMTAALFQCLRIIQPINLDVLDDVGSQLACELRVSKSCSHCGS